MTLVGRTSLCNRSFQYKLKQSMRDATSQIHILWYTCYSEAYRNNIWIMILWKKVTSFMKIPAAPKAIKSDGSWNERQKYLWCVQKFTWFRTRHRVASKSSIYLRGCNKEFSGFQLAKCRTRNVPNNHSHSKISSWICSLMCIEVQLYSPCALALKDSALWHACQMT